MRVGVHWIAAMFAALSVIGFAVMAVIDYLAGDVGRALVDISVMAAALTLALANGSRASARYKLTLSERHIAILVRVARSEYDGVEENAEVWSAIRAAEWYLGQVGKEQGA